MPCQKIYCPKFQGGAKNLKGEIKKKGAILAPFFFLSKWKIFLRA